jgi:hypothetical protein
LTRGASFLRIYENSLENRKIHIKMVKFSFIVEEVDFDKRASFPRILMKIEKFP